MNTVGSSMDLNRAAPSRRRFRILSTAVGAVALAVVAVLAVRREPEFKGRKLSDWITKLDTGRFEVMNHGVILDPEAVEAVRAMGQTAVPVLVRWIDSGLVSDRRRFWLETKIKRQLPDGIASLFDSRSAKAGAALLAFKALGELGATGREPLLAMAKREQSLSALWLAVAQTGTNSIPALETALASGDEFRRRNAAGAAGELGRNGASLVPLLTGLALSGPYDGTEEALALRSLGRIGEPAEEIRSVFVRVLNSTNNHLAENAAVGLAFMGPLAKEAVSELERRIQAAPSKQCRYSLIALIALSGDDQRVAELLRVRVGTVAADVLEKIAFIRQTWTNAQPHQRREVFDAVKLLLNENPSP